MDSANAVDVEVDVVAVEDSEEVYNSTKNNTTKKKKKKFQKKILIFFLTGRGGGRGGFGGGGFNQGPPAEVVRKLLDSTARKTKTNLSLLIKISHGIFCSCL